MSSYGICKVGADVCGPRKLPKQLYLLSRAASMRILELAAVGVWRRMKGRGRRGGDGRRGRGRSRGDHSSGR